MQAPSAVAPEIALSVVSHGQNALVNTLLRDLRNQPAGRLTVIVTLNIDDTVALDAADAQFPVEIIANQQAKGFGANHNAAFERCRAPYFCVANPDIRLGSDPFTPLLSALEESAAAVAGPLVRNPLGGVEDSARRFPTLGSLLGKLAGIGGGAEYAWDRGPIAVDWLAGMFMLFRSEDFRAVRGFDERYFLYYEDVDICRRLQKAGKRVLYQPGAEVIHAARRASRRNLRYLRHHLQSMLRYFTRA